MLKTFPSTASTTEDHQLHRCHHVDMKSDKDSFVACGVLYEAYKLQMLSSLSLAVTFCPKFNAFCFLDMTLPLTSTELYSCWGHFAAGVNIVFTGDFFKLCEGLLAVISEFFFLMKQIEDFGDTVLVTSLLSFLLSAERSLAFLLSGIKTLWWVSVTIHVVRLTFTNGSIYTVQYT